jgi:hypothetical protein
MFIRASVLIFFYLKLKLLDSDVVHMQRVHLTANSVTHLGLATDVGSGYTLNTTTQQCDGKCLHCLNMKFACPACVCLYLELNC